MVPMSRFTSFNLLLYNFLFFFLSRQQFLFLFMHEDFLNIKFELEKYTIRGNVLNFLTKCVKFWVWKNARRYIRKERVCGVVWWNFKFHFFYWFLTCVCVWFYKSQSVVKQKSNYEILLIFVQFSNLINQKYNWFFLLSRISNSLAEIETTSNMTDMAKLRPSKEFLRQNYVYFINSFTDNDPYLTKQ